MIRLNTVLAQERTFRQVRKKGSYEWASMKQLQDGDTSETKENRQRKKSNDKCGQKSMMSLMLLGLRAASRSMNQ